MKLEPSNSNNFVPPLSRKIQILGCWHINMSELPHLFRIQEAKEGYSIIASKFMILTKIHLKL